ncbi:hypothetical protein, partial [Paraburkholderia graminis]
RTTRTAIASAQNTAAAAISICIDARGALIMNGVAWIMLVLAAIAGAFAFAAAGTLMLLLLIADVAQRLTRDDDNRGDY